jgi:DNA-binding SARP family transcriptional activator/tetratricopeptide (TPR) repeat protein/TolB-like protein
MSAEGDPAPFGVAPFELRVLGAFELAHRPSGALIPISAAKMRALIAYLAAAPRNAEVRRTLAGLLWASSGEDQARQSMRQLLSNFRRNVGPDVAGLVAFDDSLVSLDPSLVAIDRTRLMNVAGDADLASLVETADLYRGDFAPGLDIAEPEFDEWLRAERMRCREAAIKLFDALVRKLAGGGRHGEALKYANRLAEIDPLREETHRLIIAEEAIVSGRASAMLRYEAFRILLRDELGVKPEPATLRLLEGLRQQPAPAIDPAPKPEPIPPPAQECAAPREARRWRRPALAAALAAIALIGAFAVFAVWRPFYASIADSGEEVERASLVVLPFDFGAGLDSFRAQASAYQAGVAAAFARNGRLSMVAAPAGQSSRDPVGVGDALKVRYVVKTDVTQTPDGARADAVLYDAATGGLIFTTPLAMGGDKADFARKFYEAIYPAVLLHRANELALRAPDSIPALLWRAAAQEGATGVRVADPPEFATFEKVLAQDPGQFDALLGLANGLIERVARDLSRGVNRTADLDRAASLLEQARLEERTRPQSARIAEIAFLEGMIEKLQSKFVEARENFLTAVKYAPEDAVAAAEAAHVLMFLGRLDEAYEQMRAIRNFDVDESSFIAAETALISGHPETALAYYDMAVSATPQIPRIYAWRSVALWRQHREEEAHQNALKSQTMTPAYMPYWMQGRGQFADKRYRDARDMCVQDFEKALAYKPPS